MAFTLQDVYNSCYGIIAQSQDATAYPTSLLLTFINKAQNDICYGNVKNLGDGSRLDKQALTFLERNQFYTTHNFTTLAADAVVGATTLTMTNTLSTSGYIWINGAIISYSANNGTTLSGIPATGVYSIPFAFVAGTQAFQLNTLPTDFGQVSRAFLTMQTSRYRYQLVPVDDRDLSTPIPNTGLYNFFFNQGYNYNGTGFGQEWYYSLLRGTFVFFMVPQTDDQPISFEYQIAPTQLALVTDTLTIPDAYSLNTIPYMAVSEMMANRGEMDEAIKLNNFGYQNIQSMYEFYATQRGELPYNVRVRNSSDGFGNF